MKCPIDGTELLMTERSGVEIDYCPKCRGVWLDRGELDKIIERAEPQARPATRPEDPRQPEPQPQPDFRDPEPAPVWAREDFSGSGSRSGKPYRKKKRGGFLGEIFDFD
ncbi:TFIIB-type zinc ribbon-containing protein [Chachezhania sediminis]|uniref:TFIIB-type zinc ribbon-containing protein n=1 Tax=Chachezhania sediminis TaxID=2599291 RepID=UPI00131B2498|nr:zf-TFIIB domain-containing protein [Chachezhania sediminis]